MVSYDYAIATRVTCCRPKFKGRDGSRGKWHGMTRMRGCKGGNIVDLLGVVLHQRLGGKVVVAHGHAAKRNVIQ